MKILLDTHLLLWWLQNDAALPDYARLVIADPENSIFVSAVSEWEIWLKVSLGKLRLPADFEAVLAAQQLERLPMTGEHARELARLPWIHRDPFDRMLVAQARVSRLELLTADKTLAAYGDPVVLAK